MNPSPRELKRRRRTALTLYMDKRPLAYIAKALGMTEAGVYELLEQAGAKNIQYEGAGTPDPLLEAPTMPKKLKTYEELLIENLQLRNENLRLRRLHACDANPILVRS
ncbi:hypothetical protein [Exiguobacterium sp. s102]|uniref:hypothetical protein n=1 Tax=Exiguobacterium sp. s102 TaxID=2751212 RepID=UPI001BE79740|nr:hypothetical protein [Exiguobacterium sp. s102]